MTTYYTLRCGKPLINETIYSVDGEEARYPSYEEAYDVMCGLYAKEENPNRWGIWETKVSEYNGQTNEFTQAVWR